MLKMMNSVERISTLIPSFKLQLIFLEEREKLFKNIADGAIQVADTSFKTTTSDQSLNTLSMNASTLEMVSSNAQCLSSPVLNSSSTAVLSKLVITDSSAERSNFDASIDTTFPDNYKIPLLPNGLIKDIQDGNTAKFGPHCTNRRIIIDAVVHDIIHKYNLL